METYTGPEGSWTTTKRKSKKKFVMLKHSDLFWVVGKRNEGSGLGKLKAKLGETLLKLKKI